MKNFNQKVKFEERQEIYEKQGHISSSQQIKPQFLSNDSLMASLPQSNFPASPYRPKSTLTNFHIKMLTEKERKPSEISPSAHRNSLQEDLGVRKALKAQKSTKKTMRRRSCCCEWCGGISSLEVKHQDVVLEDDLLQSQLKIDLAVSRDETVEKVEPTEEKATPTMKGKQDASPKAENKLDQSKLSPYKLLTISTVDPTPISVEQSSDLMIRYNSSQTPNSVLIASPEAKGNDQLDGYKIPKTRKKTDPKLQDQDFLRQSSSAFLLTRQGSFSPIRLRRDKGMPSIEAKKAENKKADSVTIDLPTINGPTLNANSSPKWIASPINVMQKLCRDVSGFFPGSPQKMAKLTSPMSASLAEKIRMQNMKLESFNVKDRIATEPDKKRGESSITNLLTEEGEDTVVLKSTGHQFKSKNRLSSGVLKKENSLRAIRAKIAAIYTEEKSSSPTIYNKTMTKIKSSTPLKRVASETQTLLFKTDYKAETQKQRFLETSKEFVVKEEGRPDGKSPRTKKLKKRKNTGVDWKAKEEHVKWLKQNFVPSKKNSMTVFPNIPQSLQNKIVKRREESRKFDEIQQIVASYAE